MVLRPEMEFHRSLVGWVARTTRNEEAMLRRVAPTAIVGGALVLLLTAYLAADTSTVEKPMFNGNRLGWCANWGADCGEPAAEAWCIAQGFAGAEAFVRAPGIGDKSPTRLIATGAICDSAECDGFKEITCRKLDTVDPAGAGETAAPPLPPPRAAEPVEVKAELPVPDQDAATADLPPDPESVPVPLAAPEPAVATTPAVADIPEPPPPPESPVKDDAKVAAALPAVAAGDAGPTGATSVPPNAAEGDAAAEDDPGPPPPDTITLAAAGAPPLRPVLEIFKAPTFNGRRLDWCRGWKDACGKATADEFCRLNGFVQALSFAPDPKIGAAQPTRQIASGLVCDHDGCDGFAEIACTK
jgi:hypothetical protein